MSASTKLWVDNSPPQCAAADLNGFKNENNLMITSAGIALNTADNTQTTKAAAVYAGAGEYYNETGSGNTYVLAATSSGGGTLQTPPAYRDGLRVRFNATHTNSSAATLNLNAIGPKNIVTYTGAALVGGELVSGQYYELVYFLSPDAFYMQQHSDVPVGVVWDYGGFVAPSGFLLSSLLTASRTTYAVLFAAVTFTRTGTTASGVATITGLASTADLYAGLELTCPNFSGIVEIQSVDSGTQITVTPGTATTTGSNTVTFYPWGAGDGSVTFGLPGAPGRSSMAAGSGAGLTPRLPGQKFGEENHTPSLSELINHDHEVGAGCGAPFGTTLSGPGDRGGVTASGNGTTTSTGSSTPFNVLGPTEVMNKIVKY